ncbi:Ig-like domain-containing protein, partial [Spirosoma litoris]
MNMQHLFRQTLRSSLPYLGVCRKQPPVDTITAKESPTNQAMEQTITQRMTRMKRSCVSAGQYAGKRYSTVWWLCTLLVLLSTSQTTYAQSVLELAAGSSSAGNGPTTAPQTATFLKNTDSPTGNTFSAYTPGLTVTASLSNQQFNASSSNNAGITFGGASNSVSNPVTFPLFPLFTGLCSDNSNAYYTSPQNQTPGTGYSVSANSGFSTFYNTSWLNGQSTNNQSAGYYYGDITFTFSRPVNNPILHISDIGGSIGALNLGTYYKLQTPGVTMSLLSGNNLNVTTTEFKQSALTGGCGTASQGGSGSILLNGTGITSVTFQVYMLGNGGAPDWPTYARGDVVLYGFTVSDGVPDASISKVGSTMVSPNGVVSYTLLVSNNGTTNLTNVTVTDPVVANYNVTSVSCTVGGGTASCPTSPTPAGLQSGLVIPSLPASSTVVLVVTGTATGQSGSAITNVASVSAAGDTNPANNSSTAVTQIATPTCDATAYGVLNDHIYKINGLTPSGYTQTDLGAVLPFTAHDLAKGCNNKLYTVTSTGAAPATRNIYVYDPVTNTGSNTGATLPSTIPSTVAFDSYIISGATDANCNIYFISRYGGYLAKYDPTTNTVTNIWTSPPPTAVAGPGGITYATAGLNSVDMGFGADGALYIITDGTYQIWKIPNPASPQAYYVGTMTGFPSGTNLADIMSYNGQTYVVSAAGNGAGIYLVNPTTFAATPVNTLPSNGYADMAACNSFLTLGNPVTANNDLATTAQGTPVTIPVLTNDTDNGSPATTSNVTLPTIVTPPSASQGTAVVNSDGTITFTPAPGFSGSSTFTYSICDKTTPTNCATATVGVTTACSNSVMLVGDYPANSVEVFNYGTNAATFKCAVQGIGGDGIAANENTGIAYFVQAKATGTVYVFDYKKGSVVTSIPLTVSTDIPFDAAISPDRAYVYVTSNSYLYKISTATNTIVASRPTSDFTSSSKQRAWGVAVNPITGNVYMTTAYGAVAGAASTITYLDPSLTGSISTLVTAPTGYYYRGIVFDATGNLWAVMSSDGGTSPDKLVEYNGTTGAKLGEYSMPTPTQNAGLAGTGSVQAYDIAFGPDGNIYISSFKGDCVTRFDLSTNTFSTYVPYVAGSQAKNVAFICGDFHCTTEITANPDSKTTTVNTAVNIPVLSNDTYVGNTPTTSNVKVTVTSQPANGSASVNPDGTIAFTPVNGFVGSTTFTYSICEVASLTNCSSTTVTVTIAGQPPVATSDINNTRINTPVPGNVLT